MPNNLRFSMIDPIRSIGLRGAYFVLEDMRNRESDPEFEEIRRRVTSDILADLSLEKIEQDPILQGYRQLHKAVEASNKNVAAPENLLRQLLKKGQLPSVNLIVDIYNLVSIRTRLALGAHDLDKVTGDIQLRLADGTESFHPLGSHEPKPVRTGEYCYIDAANDVICHLEVRQVEKTKVTADTTACFYIVQGNQATSRDYLWRGLQELLALTQRFCGGRERILFCPPEDHELSKP